MKDFKEFTPLCNNEMKTINGGTGPIADFPLPDVDLGDIDWEKWDWYLDGGTYPF